MKNIFQRFCVFIFFISLSFYSCEDSIEGCIDELACNYNSEATETLPGACNYPIEEILEVIYMDAVVSGSVGEDIISHVHIRNSSCNTVSLIARKIYNGSEETSAYFCFSGVCFSSDTVVSPIALTLDSFQEDDYFKGYFSSSIPGEFQVTYRFYLEEDPTISVEVDITYMVS